MKRTSYYKLLEEPPKSGLTLETVSYLRENRGTAFSPAGLLLAVNSEPDRNLEMVNLNQCYYSGYIGRISFLTLLAEGEKKKWVKKKWIRNCETIKLSKPEKQQYYTVSLFFAPEIEHTDEIQRIVQKAEAMTAKFGNISSSLETDATRFFFENYVLSKKRIRALKEMTVYKEAPVVIRNLPNKGW